MARVIRKLPAVLQGHGLEQAVNVVVTHQPARFHPAEALASTDEKVFEFAVLLVDHDLKLPLRCHHQRRLHAIEGRSYQDRPDPPPAHYTRSVGL
jgi:hypothetical protein